MGVSISLSWSTNRQNNQTQGKIERYHRTMKIVVKLHHYYFPWELEAALKDFVSYYNNKRYHESLDIVDLEKKLAVWEHFYNFDRPHGAQSGKTPYEALPKKLSQ